MKKVDKILTEQVILDVSIFLLKHGDSFPVFSLSNSTFKEDERVKILFNVAEEHGYKILSEPDKKEGYTKLTCST